MDKIEQAARDALLNQQIILSQRWSDADRESIARSVLRAVEPLIREQIAKDILAEFTPGEHCTEEGWGMEIAARIARGPDRVPDFTKGSTWA